ncbi:L-2-hydroxyglutarate oxidase [Janibacter sp. YIM B02568]|uniref:L-2-hydroxyglutarate oxidase n=1 Tax=Janibacter endophyticus TaxID=2806261 RepID=UPI001951399A|nr:L-2-hydroxyglutarate oxidase [Janibacter endophyticus]MBM6547160.1 L-2-hydroxyglutarate oxidase [Janibacter endophyticus]
MTRLRAAVVGGGIIGTAVARHLAREHGADVTLLEKEDRLAAHQTGHNSGVVHAGLYYEPGSLKATLCRRGVGLLQDFVAQHDIAYDECGKVVVALDDVQAGRLGPLHERAVANGVPGVRLVEGDELREIEPGVAGVRAIHSPRTAIVDFPAVTEALGAELVEAGGAVRLGHEVRSISVRGGGVRVGTTTKGGPGGSEDGGEFALVVACGGLQSDRLAALLGERRDPRIVPFYGDYFVLPREQRPVVRGMVYPVPDPRYPFLGVHVTPRVDGVLTLGPNAFLSLGRESYERGRPVARDVRDVVGYPGFWRFAARNVPAAVRETRTALSSGQFLREAVRYVPGLDVSRAVRGTRGVRAQAMAGDGRLVDDFVITGTDRVVVVRNAPSPGATSALAIAEHIAAEAMRRRSGR